jgi:alanine racemase
VKADGYGHGAAEVARAALEGGAASLAVALVEEGVALRRAGVDASILVLSEPPSDAMAAVVEHGLTPTLYSAKAVEAAAGAAPAGAPLAVHVKADTGMHRVGARPDEAASLARLVHDTPSLHLEGLWTHLAVADDPDDPYTAEQLERFEDLRSRLAAAGVVPDVVHAANSAGAIAHPASRYDVVRCGIALYGEAPSAALAGHIELQPAMSLKARVSFVKRVPAGARISYGLRYTAPVETTIATVPLGYADGLARRSFDVGGEVLVDGRRCPLAGVVTMDQVMVDCGPDAHVELGDEVVVIGAQGGDAITAHEWAERLGTISYEVLCGIGPRVPRVYRR